GAAEKGSRAVIFDNGQVVHKELATEARRETNWFLDSPWVCASVVQESGRWGPYRQASPPPARHRPGARSARRQRWCFHCIADQSSQGVFAMRTSSWLRSARSLLVPSGTENGHHPTRLRMRAMAAQLSVERLEDRTVPSTFTVGNLADSGPGSLRQAILDANDNLGADTIRFAPAARDGTLTLTSGQLSITDDLILDGPGVHRLTISGNDASRV